MTGSPPERHRGILFPRRLVPGFRRVDPDPGIRDLVAWWWLAAWDLADGEHSDQHLVAFPTGNLAVEDAMVGLAGPTTRASTRRLTGRGWVVGALLRPAALGAIAEPASIRDRYVPLNEPGLHEHVVAAIGGGHLEGGVPVVADWLWAAVGPVTEEGLLANRLADVAGGGEARTVAELAGLLAVSERTLHRLAARYLGLTPYALLRRRRIQEAAEAVRERADVPLADLAAELGFTDHAHLTREFRQVIGITPAAYRARAREG